MTPWLVVPTLGNRDETLAPLLASAGMPSVIVHTDATWDGDPYPGSAVTVHDTRLNIHGWWNAGIRVAHEEGADVIVIVNDDIRAGTGELVRLASHIDPADDMSPVIVWPEDVEHSATRVTSVTGYCFAIDPARIRPDETLSWWWGEHDMELRARAQHSITGRGGVRAISGLDIAHLRQGYGYDRPVRHLIDADRSIFEERYPDLSRWVA